MTAQPRLTPEDLHSEQGTPEHRLGKCFSLSSGPMGVRRVGRPSVTAHLWDPEESTQERSPGDPCVELLLPLVPEDTKMHAGEGVALTVLGSALPATHSRVT